jgi:dTMP kinase
MTISSRHVSGCASSSARRRRVLRVGTLIVIEGLDGSGKRTLTEALAGQWRSAGRTVATMAFPRYGVDVHADLVQDALYGRLGDLADSVYGPAVLFALDRRAAAAQIRELLEDNDLVLLDRYVTSNAAYGSARLGGPELDTGFADWVLELEIERFGVPLPDRQILLATPLEVAAERARRRAVQTVDRALDSFEADSDLQRRTGAMYRLLAAQEYLSPWTVLGPEADGSLSIPAELAG